MIEILARNNRPSMLFAGRPRCVCRRTTAIDVLLCGNFRHGCKQDRTAHVAWLKTRSRISKAGSKPQRITSATSILLADLLHAESNGFQLVPFRRYARCWPCSRDVPGRVDVTHVFVNTEPISMRDEFLIRHFH